MRLGWLVAVVAVALASCQKPAGYRGVEVLEVSEQSLLNCIAEQQAPTGESIVIVRHESDLEDTFKFEFERNEVGEAVDPCRSMHELEDFDFEEQSLLQVTWTYNDFGGREDGNYVIRYFEHKDENNSILRVTLREERGHDADNEDRKQQTVWLAVPALAAFHSIEFDKRIDTYRAK